MPPDHTRLLEDQAHLLRSLLRDPPSDESWAPCEEAWTRAVALAVEAVRLPPVRLGRQRRQPDPSNAVDIQRLCRCNRRRAVRLILGDHPRRASPMVWGTTPDHWGRTWSAHQADSTLLMGREPAPAGVDTTNCSPEEEERCTTISRTVRDDIPTWADLAEFLSLCRVLAEARVA
ncbi:hypothetical protein MRX96_046369 [Rhipicephalus microplus]